MARRTLDEIVKELIGKCVLIYRGDFALMKAGVFESDKLRSLLKEADLAIAILGLEEKKVKALAIKPIGEEVEERELYLPNAYVFKKPRVRRADVEKYEKLNEWRRVEV